MDLARARTAVVVAFGISGLCFASWLSRVPAAQDALSLTSSELGLLLLCLSGGACIALPISGPLVHRLGAAKMVWVGSNAVSLGLLCFSLSLLTGAVWLAAVGLILTGIGMGNWDVAMNVEGALIEHLRRRSLLPKLHGTFSLGTVLGGAIGVAAAAIGLPLAVQVLGVVVITPVSMLVATRFFLPTTDPTGEQRGKSAHGLGAWREPRILLIGFVTLAFAFTEGVANDWLAVAFVTGHHTSEALGAVGFGVFVAGMTVGRFSGELILKRFSRVVVLRSTALLAVVGLLLVTLTSSIVLIVVGAMLWGLGASLGFPIGMSAAADDPAQAAVRVSVVSSIAYTAFLAGPPLIGFIAEHSDILRALFVVFGVLILGGLMSTATQQPHRETSSG